MAVGFYFGSRSVIPGQDLFFAEVEDREPANELSNFSKALAEMKLWDDNNLKTIIVVEKLDDGAEAKSLCAAVPEAVSYAVTVEVEGVAIHGDEKVQFVLEGSCDRDVVIAFDQRICGINRQLLESPYPLANGLTVKGINLLNPFQRNSFSVSEIKLTLSDGAEEYAGRDILNEMVQTSFLCNQ